MIDCVPETTNCVPDGGSLLQRTGHNSHTVVSFTAETDFSGKREELLSRDTHKQRLVPVISDELRERECNVVNEQVW